MPLVQYRFPVKGIEINKRMSVPTKQIHNPLRWYKDARKVIPELPSICDGRYDNTDECTKWHSPPADHWHFVLDKIWEATVDYLKYEFRNELGERAYLVIQRRA